MLSARSPGVPLTLQRSLFCHSGSMVWCLAALCGDSGNEYHLAATCCYFWESGTIYRTPGLMCLGLVTQNLSVLSRLIFCSWLFSVIFCLFYSNISMSQPVSVWPERSCCLSPLCVVLWFYIKLKRRCCAVNGDHLVTEDWLPGPWLAMRGCKRLICRQIEPNVFSSVWQSKFAETVPKLHF